MKSTKITLMIALIALMSLIVSACGSKNNNNNGEASSPAVSSQTASETASTPASEAPAAATKMYKDGLDREVEVPTNPQRVIALANMGELLSLGVKPIGTTDYYFTKFEKERMEGVESIGSDQANVEKSAALEPDLIIVSSYFDPKLIEDLQKIAPTIATKWGLTPLEHLHNLAVLLGKEDAEKAWLDQYAAKVEEAKTKLQPFKKEDETAVVIQFWTKSIYQHATNVFPAVFDGVGFLPTEQEKAVTASAELTEEAVAGYVGDADRLFILIDGQADEDRYNQLKTTAWKNVPAVKNNQVYLVNSPKWNDFSTAAMEWQLADLVSLIAK